MLFRSAGGLRGLCGRIGGRGPCRGRERQTSPVRTSARPGAGFWRSGRIVPPRTRRPRRENRGITRKSSSAFDGVARAILPEHHFCTPPPRTSWGLPDQSSRRCSGVPRRSANRVTGREARGNSHRAKRLDPKERTRPPPRGFVQIPVVVGGASTTLFSLYYAPSPSTVREKGA